MRASLELKSEIRIVARLYLAARQRALPSNEHLILFQNQMFDERQKC